ncbi:hypothetical protein BC941DRAFT_409591 [Chlamydoabsidia padenii]|nr:hypothetical protein BC941DRAFT_409591 [Chlamydoabsidia padenii]
MSSQPVVYCCLPRPGIIFMSAVFAIWELIKSFNYFVIQRDTFQYKTFFLFLSNIARVVTLVSAFGFIYAGYLAFKRSYKPFNRLMYLFVANLAFDLYSAIWTISNTLTASIRNKDHVKDHIIQGFKNHTLSYNSIINNNTMTNGTISNRTLNEESAQNVAEVVATGIQIFVPLFLCLLVIVPFLNKLYFVSKIHTYVKYVLYKKEEAPSIQTPHQLPQCSKLE